MSEISLMKSQSAVDTDNQVAKEPSVKGNPLVILLFILLIAGALTYLVDSGSYQRDGKVVIPGTFQLIEKDTSISHLLSVRDKEDIEGATPASVADLLQAIPKGLDKASGLIFMVLVIGGMFGILTSSGAIDNGLHKLIGLVKGNIFALTIILMTVFSFGSTMLGLASEYLLVIPIMVALSRKVGLDPIYGFAILTISVKVGYIASILNPLPLTIAQPLVGLPIFSGAMQRSIYFAVFLVLGVGFMIYKLRKANSASQISIDTPHFTIPFRHVLMLAVMFISIIFLAIASNQWQWKHQEITSYYILISILLALISGYKPSEAAEVFVEGMKKVLLASFLIGVASAVAIVLSDAYVLDTIVNWMSGFIGEGNKYAAVTGMFVSQLLLDVLIPSTSGQAAVSIPILSPLGQLSGVTSQQTVTAFLFGNGITNLLTPTSGTLLAYLATAGISWTRWFKFVLPLWFIFSAAAVVLLCLAVS